MKFEKQYIIEKWIEWNVTLSNAIDDFMLTYSFAPNILEANQHTYSQIDFLTNVVPGEKEKLYRLDEETEQVIRAKENEDVGISAFEFDTGNIEFAVDENLPDKEFLLVYDSDPEWEREIDDPIPVEGEKKGVEV